MKKKILSAILCATMVIGLLAGCGSKPAAESDSSGKDDKKTESTKGIAKEDIKVGFVHISDASDMGYTYNHDGSVQKRCRNLWA